MRWLDKRTPARKLPEEGQKIQITPERKKDNSFDAMSCPEFSEGFAPDQNGHEPVQLKRKPDLSDQIDRAAIRSKSSDYPISRARTPAEDIPSIMVLERETKAEISPPTEIENRCAGEKMAEELRDIQIVAQELPNRAAHKKRKSMGRTNQIKTRLTDAELSQFQRRVHKSGLPQGDYLRSAALTGEIRIEEHSVCDIALLDELVLIRAELGRQGGLLKMIIKPNEGRRELSPVEWAELIDTIRNFEQMKIKLEDLEVKIRHGNRNT